MKIRMKADISGSRNGQPWPRRGETTEVPDAEGADLCSAGIAEPVTGRKVETAVVPDDSEKREVQEPTPLTTGSAPAAAKKTAPRKTPAKKTAAPAKAAPKPAADGQTED